MKEKKDKSLRSTMKSWIMLSDKELDDTQVYMKEQDKTTDIEDNDANISDKTDDFSEEAGLYSDRAGLYTDMHGEDNKEEAQIRKHRSRDEEINQLMQEVGQEVVDSDEEEVTPRKRRKRHKDKKEGRDRRTDNRTLDTEQVEQHTVNTESVEGGSSYDDTITGKQEVYREAEQEEEERIKKVDFPEADIEPVKKKENTDKADKSSKTGEMGKIVTAGIGVLLVLIIGGLGYQNQSLQRQNQKMKTQIQNLQKTVKQAEKDSEEQALQTKNEDGVVVNTDKMFASVKVGDKEYKLLAKVSDFTKDGWKLEALRTEKATLVPGGKLEKDAFLTNAEGKKIGVIIRNMSDKNQKVSDCIITKLSFSKEMFDGQLTLPEKLGFASSEKELKAAGFKKDNDGTYCYTSKKIKDDTIKMPMADGENVSEITLERNVDEATSDANATNKGTSYSSTEDTAVTATTSASDNNTTASTAQ